MKNIRNRVRGKLGFLNRPNTPTYGVPLILEDKIRLNTSIEGRMCISELKFLSDDIYRRDEDFKDYDRTDLK